MMRHLFILTVSFTLIVLTVASCVRQPEKKQTILKFFYKNTHSDKLDTITATQISRHEQDDTLIAEQIFEFKTKSHIIRMYTSDNHAPVDGGQLMYELDSLGIIYVRSTTWFNYDRLESNNDSINSLIDASLETILLYNKLCRYGPPPPPVMQIKKFIPQEVEEENK